MEERPSAPLTRDPDSATESNREADDAPMRPRCAAVFKAPALSREVRCGDSCRGGGRRTAALGDAGVIQVGRRSTAGALGPEPSGRGGGSNVPDVEGRPGRCSRVWGRFEGLWGGFHPTAALARTRPQDLRRFDPTEPGCPREPVPRRPTALGAARRGFRPIGKVLSSKRRAGRRPGGPPRERR